MRQPSQTLKVRPVRVRALPVDLDAYRAAVAARAIATAARMERAS